MNTQTSYRSVTCTVTGKGYGLRLRVRVSGELDRTLYQYTSKYTYLNVYETSLRNEPLKES